MVFAILYILDGILNILAENRANNILLYSTKILLMPLLAIYFFQQIKNIKQYRSIYFALFFSWIGDILLMFPRNESNPSTVKLLFVFGLVAFLIAHLNYIIHFVKEVKDKNKATVIIEKPYLILPFVVYGFLMLYFLFPGLGTMKLPVIIYTLIILLMAMAAFNRKNIVQTTSFEFVFIGAVLFVISDSCIAINVFYKPFNFARFVIMSTYIVAQFLIIFGILKSKEIS